MQDYKTTARELAAAVLEASKQDDAGTRLRVQMMIRKYGECKGEESYLAKQTLAFTEIILNSNWLGKTSEMDQVQFEKYKLLVAESKNKASKQYQTHVQIR